MHRRTFCKKTIGAMAATILPVYRRESQTPGSAAAPIPAVTGSGETIEIETAAVGKLAAGIKGRLLLPADPVDDETYFAAIRHY